MRTEQLSPRVAALAEAIDERFAGRLERVPTELNAGQLAYEVDAAALLDVCRTLRDDEAFRFEMLMDLAGVDYLVYGRDEWQTESATGTGFSGGVFRGYDNIPLARDDQDTTEYRPKRRCAVVYQLMSITHARRVRLRTFCTAVAQPLVDSVTDVWSAADWYEREAFDLYGILFRGHPDLRRLLTDYGFIGHPFRK